MLVHVDMVGVDNHFRLNFVQVGTVELDDSVARGEWDFKPILPMFRMHGLTVGIVGCGRIGSRVGRAAVGLGINPIYEFGSDEQKERWLPQMARGEVLGCFGLTEPDFGSNPGGMRTKAVRTDNGWVLNGEKLWCTNGTIADLMVVMARTSDKRITAFIVETDSPGVEVVHRCHLMGLHGIENALIRFTDVRVPEDNVILGPGRGFEISQGRLGPGRVHHCMRAIGMAELCLELMVARSRERKAFGRHLYQHGPIAEWIARSRIEIEQARLLVLKTAALIDNGGAQAARKEISMIKVIAAGLLTEVADRAIQVFGAMGLSPDTPLADLYTAGRALRFADGPDEVHLQTIARLEARDQQDRLMAVMRYLEPVDSEPQGRGG